MKDLLKYYVSSLSHATQTLKKKSILVEKPWALVDNEGAIQKLIFRRDKKLVLSKNGVVTEGSWDYYSEARSLFIDRGTDKLLLNEQYIDDSVLILKKDGSDSEFFTFANENAIPDYDVAKHLDSIYTVHYAIREYELTDGSTFRIIKGNDYALYELQRNKHAVEIRDKNYNTYEVDDGSYFSKPQKLMFHVKENRLEKLTFLRKYELAVGWEITINKKHIDRISKNDEVVDGKPIFPIPDGKYRIKGRWRWVRIKNCVIV